MILSASLSHNDVPWKAMLPTKQLDTKHFWVRVLSILRRTTLLLGSPAGIGLESKAGVHSDEKFRDSPSQLALIIASAQVVKGRCGLCMY